jgi:hypothetical protein
LTDDLGLQNAVVVALGAPGVGSMSAAELFEQLGVDGRYPRYELDEFIAFLELMRDEGLVTRQGLPGAEAQYSMKSV